MLTLAQTINSAVAAVCPIIGVVIGQKTNKATWRLDFAPSATAEQKAAAQAVVDAFNIDTYNSQEQLRVTRQSTLETLARTDTMIERLRKAPVADITDFINTNVTDLASARAMLIKLALALSYLLRHDV